MCKYIYLSHSLNSETPLYRNIGSFKILFEENKHRTETHNKAYLFFPNHVGTHIDFPYHFSLSGLKSNDYTICDFIISNIYVFKIDVQPSEIIKIEIDMLNKVSKDVEMLIIKTGFEKYRGFEKYWRENPGIAPSMAGLLKKKFPRLKFLGFDFISISSYQNRQLGREAHYEFLIKNDILLIEDMKLSSLNKSPKEIIIAPLLVDGVDGVPVTVICKV